MKTITYTVLTAEAQTDGSVLCGVATYTAPAEGFYKAIQNHVGGVFDVTRTPDGLSVYCHDEGLLIGLPMNPYAAALWSYGLAGTLVVTGDVDAEGYDTDVPEGFAERAAWRCELLLNALRAEAGLPPLEGHPTSVR